MKLWKYILGALTFIGGLLVINSSKKTKEIKKKVETNKKEIKQVEGIVDLNIGILEIVNERHLHQKHLLAVIGHLRYVLSTNLAHWVPIVS